MRILVIPDVHGDSSWKDNFLSNIDKVDRCVFLGDYFDSFDAQCRGEAAAKNFEDILKTTENYKVDILLGNHDAAYCMFANGSIHVSGHQFDMMSLYNSLLEANRSRIKIAVKYGKWVFSHAGISNNWYRDTKALYAVRNIKVPNGPINLANYLWKNKDLYALNFSDKCFNPTGDSIFSPPLWIRPNSLLKDAYYKNQIVGHTEVKTNKPVLFKHNNNTVIIVDSISHDKYLIVDTEDDAFTKNQCEEFEV